MDISPLFSVLIANYNNAQYIQETLESVFKQTYANWEIIIVDDGSTDNSREVYKNLENNPKIKIIYNQKNRGIGYTKAKCIEIASGDICGFVDPDDAITNETLATFVDVFNKSNGNLALMHGRAYICDEFLNIETPTFHGKQNTNKDPYFFNLDYSIAHPTAFSRKKYLETTGIDVRLKRAVDQDLYLKLCEVGDSFFIDKLLYKYRIHQGGVSTFKNQDKAIYWHWVVIIEAARRRNVEIEDLFIENYVRRVHFDELNNKYLKLKKYKKLNNILGRIKRKFI